MALLEAGTSTKSNRPLLAQGAIAAVFWLIVGGAAAWGPTQALSKVQITSSGVLKLWQ
jgi:hypothetical protein